MHALSLAAPNLGRIDLSMQTRSHRHTEPRVQVVSTAYYHDVVADDEPIIRMQSRFGALRVAVSLRRALAVGGPPRKRAARLRRH